MKKTVEKKLKAKNVMKIKRTMMMCLSILLQLIIWYRSFYVLLTQVSTD